MTTFKDLLADERGQGMTEYAVLLGTMSLGAILMLLTISGQVRAVFNNVSNQVNTLPTT